MVILEKLGGGIRGNGPRLPRLQSRMSLDVCIISLSYLNHLEALFNILSLSVL
jgi:hypothetical protein